MLFPLEEKHQLCKHLPFPMGEEWQRLLHATCYMSSRKDLRVQVHVLLDFTRSLCGGFGLFCFLQEKFCYRICSHLENLRLELKGEPYIYSWATSLPCELVDFLRPLHATPWSLRMTFHKPRYLEMEACLLCVQAVFQSLAIT